MICDSEQQLKYCRESLERIVNDKVEHHRRRSAAKVLLSYLDTLDNITRIQGEDDILKPRIANRGNNPANWLFKENMCGHRELKAKELQAIRAEIVRNSGEIWRALKLFDYEDDPIPTQELTAEQCIVRRTIKQLPGDSLETSADSTDLIVAEADKVGLTVAVGLSPTKHTAVSVIEESVLQPGAGDLMHSETCKQKGKSSGRGRTPQNDALKQWLENTETENQDLPSFCVYAHRKGLQLPQYGGLGGYQLWAEALDKKEKNLRDWFNDAKRSARR